MLLCAFISFWYAVHVNVILSQIYYCLRNITSCIYRKPLSLSLSRGVGRDVYVIALREWFSPLYRVLSSLHVYSFRKNRREAIFRETSSIVLASTLPSRVRRRNYTMQRFIPPWNLSGRMRRMGFICLSFFYVRLAAIIYLQDITQNLVSKARRMNAHRNSIRIRIWIRIRIFSLSGFSFSLPVILLPTK